MPIVLKTSKATNQLRCPFRPAAPSRIYPRPVGADVILRSDFGGQPGQWAYSESPLIDGDRLVCTPGGDDATMVALDKKTGKEVWRHDEPGGSSGLGDDKTWVGSWSTPIVVEMIPHSFAREAALSMITV